MPINETKHEDRLKAGALLCPVCCVEYVEVQADFDIDGKVLRDIKMLRCPVCQEEKFTQQQQEIFEKRLSKL
jgi:hypothetical protein